jgi:hypothetical protein
MTLIKKVLLAGIILIATNSLAFSQCCSAGGANPVAGDISTSLLMKGQMDIVANHQFVNSNKFLNYTTPDLTYLNNFTSNYLYSRVAYGITKELTISAETGYWINKTQIGVNNADTISSSGIGDIIIFPRLNVYSKNKFEITTGLGIKIPIGSYNDSIGILEPFSGETFYINKPPAIQLSTGSHDFIFNIFASRKFPEIQARIFANTVYIKKGWNPLGEKMGDYFSFSLVASKSFFQKLTILTHAKFEFINLMSINEDIMMVSFPNYDPLATGSKKLFVVPQINFSPTKNISIFALCEIPVYQYVNKTQIASQWNMTAGISYRIQIKKEEINPSI